MTQTRFVEFFIIILLNSVIISSSFAAKIAIIQYEVKEMGKGCRI